MRELRRKPIVLVLFIITVLIILLFALYPPVRRDHIRKVLNRYDQVRVGMQESEVVRLLGRPRLKTCVKTAELGQEILAWDVTIEMINELRSKYIWLIRYSYWITDPPLRRGIGMRVGLDVFINEKDSTIVLVRRLR